MTLSNKWFVNVEAGWCGPYDTKVEAIEALKKNMPRCKNYVIRSDGENKGGLITPQR